MTINKAPPNGPSKRRLSYGRRLYYAIGLPVFSFVLTALWRSYRVQYLPDQQGLLKRPPEFYAAPCYWHQDHVLCSYLIRRWLKQGYKAGFLVSDSVDGEVPARLAQSWGARVVRGSANRTGAAAMRDLRAFANDNVAVVTTADGPLGPCYEFKAGVVVTANLVKAPMLPIAAAAQSAWYLRRWDNFMIPKPFSRVVIAIGEPHPGSQSLKADAIEVAKDDVQIALRTLKESAEALLQQ